MWMGAEAIVSARALGEAIHHCHGKDTRIERGKADVDGLLELRDVTDVASRTWNYVAVGAGRDLQWWKEFFSVVRMVGYNDWVSLEDFTMSTEAGIQSSIDALQATISLFLVWPSHEARRRRRSAAGACFPHGAVSPQPSRSWAPTAALMASSPVSRPAIR
jgi:hypothetical protein